MEINLEKIELVKDRTGVSYNEAKEALESADGSVVDAIVAIEEKINEAPEATINFKDNQGFNKIKEIVEKGNISQIKIKKNGTEVINFPVTVGVLGVVLVPWVAVAGAVAALGTGCEIELIDNNGVVVDVNGKAIELYDKAKNSETAAKAKDYIGIGWQKAKEYAEIAKAKGEELYNIGKEKADEYGVKEKVEELKDKFYDLKGYVVDEDKVEVIEVPEEKEPEDADR